MVVFDCNIYLDVACLVGAPYRWDVFHSLAAKMASAPVPHPQDRANDSLRAIAVCMGGRFAAAETVEVWTNAHIDQVVRAKATQPTTPDPRTGYRGLGWSREHAQTLVDDLITTVTESSAGGTLGDSFPDGNPPLDHEDGMVYGACRELAGNDPLCRVYCVTRDGGFLSAAQRGSLRDHTIVLTPSKFVELNRAARRHYAIPRMRPQK